MATSEEILSKVLDLANHQAANINSLVKVVEDQAQQIRDLVAAQVVEIAAGSDDSEEEDIEE